MAYSSRLRQRDFESWLAPTVRAPTVLLSWPLLSAIGRKNWLFLGNDAAGERAAILYTVMATAKRHQIEPWAYVTDLLLKLTDDTPELEKLLPERWIETHPDARLTHRVEESRAKQAGQKSHRSHCRNRKPR